MCDMEKNIELEKKDPIKIDRQDKQPCTDKWTGKDKLRHFGVCFIAAVIDPALAIGLALGKEYGDLCAEGNHFCWKDLIADILGIVCGTLTRSLL